MANGYISAYRGKKYIYKITDDEIINQIVSPEELPLLLEEGWSLGREPKENESMCIAMLLAVI